MRAAIGYVRVSIGGHDLLYAGGLIQCDHCKHAITGEVQKKKYFY